MGFYLVKDYVVNSNDVRLVAPVERDVITGMYHFEIYFMHGEPLRFNFDDGGIAQLERKIFCKNIGMLR